MSLTLESANVRRHTSVSNQRISPLKRVANALRITFISGPRMLFTGHLSIKKASFMIMLCAPGMLLWALLTIPPLLFPFPEHNAYYEFAQIVTEDPAQLILLPLVVVCFFLALAIPATTSCPFGSP